MGEDQNYKFYQLKKVRKKLNEMPSSKVARIAKIAVTTWNFKHQLQDVF